MKGALCFLVGLVMLSAFAIGCAGSGQAPEQVPYQAPKPDVPSYRADQVISVASSYSPIFSKQEQMNYQCWQQPAWSAEYLGRGIWLVKKYAVSRFGNPNVYVEGWYFNEATGKLSKSLD